MTSFLIRFRRRDLPRFLGRSSRSVPKLVHLRQDRKKCFALLLKIVSAGGERSALEHVTELRESFQRGLCRFHQLVLRVCRPQTVDAGKAKGTVADAIGADNQGARRHSFDRREVKALLRIGKEQRYP